jgi:hypothetical protein
MDVALTSQLTRGGIYDRETRASFSPRLEPFRVITPREPGEVRLIVIARDGREIAKRRVRELTPNQLVLEGGQPRTRLDVVEDCPPHPPRRNRSKAQIRREATCAVEVETIPPVPVRRRGAVNESGQAFVRSATTSGDHKRVSRGQADVFYGWYCERLTEYVIRD